MNEPVEIFLGFDPGGATKTAFGWCVCKQDVAGKFVKVKTGLSTHAEAAVSDVNRVLENLKSNACVRAIGIDAPLFWNKTGEDRMVDKIIRRELLNLNRPHSTVIPVNTLKGACLVQGVLVGDSFKAPITETHPKALRWLLKSLPSELENYKADLKRSKNPNENHEWDALAAAYAAWRMYQRDPEWQDLFQKEPAPFLPFGTQVEVSYWMPIPQQPPG